MPYCNTCGCCSFWWHQTGDPPAWVFSPSIFVYTGRCLRGEWSPLVWHNCWNLLLPVETVACHSSILISKERTSKVLAGVFQGKNNSEYFLWCMLIAPSLCTKDFTLRDLLCCVFPCSKSRKFQMRKKCTHWFQVSENLERNIHCIQPALPSNTGKNSMLSSCPASCPLYSDMDGQWLCASFSPPPWCQSTLLAFCQVTGVTADPSNLLPRYFVGKNPCWIHDIWSTVTFRLLVKGHHFPIL